VRTIPDRVPWGQVGLFTALVLALPWLGALPFHLGWLPFEGVPGIALAVGAMWVPALVTLILVLTVDRGRVAARTGLVPPRGRVKRLLVGLALASLVPLLLLAASPFLTAALGLTRLDLMGLSGFRQILQQALGDLPIEEAVPLPLHAVLALQPVNIVIGGVLNVVLGAFGEEWGWRGWLLPKLRPLGAWPAVVLVGLLWGIWHAPLILLGHNYPEAPVTGVLLFLPFCILWGVLHGWTRLYTGSVWPAALMHGTLNAGAALPVLLLHADTPFDPVWDAPLGVAGWILPAVAIALLVLVGGWPPRDEPDLARDVSP
jgi:uncharacterized protein